ncbi:MAG: response regulator transcription factor [Planctomycetota bacterium]|jgi:two-component system phosphate regulon response regulator PhoB
MTNAFILIVEDEPEIADLIRYHVQREGARAVVARTGRLALEAVERRKPDLVVLDLMLPDLDGLEVCRRLRRQPETKSLPILIVSAKGEESDIVAGLELGADDYVTKPFSPKVLMARIGNLLRKRRPAGAGAEARGRLAPAAGALVIDLDRHEVEVAGRPVGLTPTEFGIVRCLACRSGFVRTREQIIASVHGETTVLSPRAVDVHMTALRRKLGKAGALIETVRGIGYRLREDRGDEDE